MEQQHTQKTAVQRIEDAEQNLMYLYDALNNVSRDLLTLREAVKLIGNKLDAVVKSYNTGVPATDETLSKFMVENNILDLKEKVASMVEQGIIFASEAISFKSFVVGQEVDQDGNIQNPRIQFAVETLSEDAKAKLLGATAGQTIVLQEGKWSISIQEVYEIRTPEEAQASIQEPTEEATVNA